MQVQLEKLSTEACECALIASLATDKTKRDLFARLSRHYVVLALEVERAMDTMCTAEGLLLNKMRLLALLKDPDTRERQEFEHRLAEIDAALNALELEPSWRQAGLTARGTESITSP